MTVKRTTKDKQKLCVIMVIVITIVLVPLMNVLFYYHYLFSSVDYRYDENTSVTVETLIQDSRYNVDDFWFKNSDYYMQTDELLKNNLYYDKLSLAERIRVREIFLQDISDFNFSETLLDRLSGKLECLSKSKALLLLTKDSPEKSIGRICLKLSNRQPLGQFDSQINSIDLLIIEDTLYALISYNTAFNTISLYKMNLSVDELINERNFTPYYEFSEHPVYIEFDTYVSLCSPILGAWGVLIFETVFALILVGVGFVSCYLMKKENK